MPESERNPICRRAGCVIAGMFLTAVAVASGATPAAAHTALENSSPGDGARVGAAPDEILLDFTEPVRVRPSRVVVRGPDGTRFESGAAAGAADKIVQPLRPLGTPGRYEVAYRVVAADGHAVIGVVRFTLTRPGPAVSIVAEPAVADGARSRRSSAGRVITGRVDVLPPWVFMTTAVAAVIVVIGAAWYGRKVTDDLD